MPASSVTAAKVSVFMSDSLLFTCTISANPFVCALFPNFRGWTTPVGSTIMARPTASMPRLLPPRRRSWRRRRRPGAALLRPRGRTLDRRDCRGSALLRTSSCRRNFRCIPAASSGCLAASDLDDGTGGAAPSVTGVGNLGGASAVPCVRVRDTAATRSNEHPRARRVTLLRLSGSGVARGSLLLLRTKATSIVIRHAPFHAETQSS